MPADRSITAIGAIQADDSDFCRTFIHDRHMHRCGFSPQAEQAKTSLRQLVCYKFPKVSSDHGARPWPALQDLTALQYAIDQRWHLLLISKLSKEASHMLEPDHERSGKIDSRNQNQREMREHRHIRGFR